MGAKRERKMDGGGVVTVKSFSSWWNMYDIIVCSINAGQLLGRFMQLCFAGGCSFTHVEMWLCKTALICVFIILGFFIDELNSAVVQCRRSVGGGEHISSG